VIIPVALLAGLVFAFALVGVARAKGPRAATRIYAAGLFIAALIYVGFAVAGGANAQWLALESAGLVLYGGAALLGLRGWPIALAVGWGAHVGWDVLLHLDGAGAAYVPVWYPWLCISFDVVLAGAALAHARRRSERPR